MDTIFQQGNHRICGLQDMSPHQIKNRQQDKPRTQKVYHANTNQKRLSQVHVKSNRQQKGRLARRNQS